MRAVDAEKIKETVKTLCLEACFDLPSDLLQALEKARGKEDTEIARSILSDLLENAGIAREERIPSCQDTGMVVVFVDMGEAVQVVNGGLREAVEAGVREAYEEGLLRKSVVRDPLRRENTGDNTPAVIHTEIVPGDGFHLIVAPKGAGSENKSRAEVLSPGEGFPGVKRFVVETVKRAGGASCPPLVVGIGLGGTLEKAAILAKRAAVRALSIRNPDPEVAKLEEELLEEINATGIGPLGLGGRTTALAVNIELYACHIASLPVAVNLNCHAARHKEASL